MNITETIKEHGGAIVCVRMAERGACMTLWRVLSPHISQRKRFQAHPRVSKKCRNNETTGAIHTDTLTNARADKWMCE